MTFLNTDQNAPKQNLEHFIRKLLSKLILGLGKGTKQKTHESESVGFLVEALPVVQNQFIEQISNKVLYNYRSLKKMEGFRQYLKK